MLLICIYFASPLHSDLSDRRRMWFGKPIRTRQSVSVDVLFLCLHLGRARSFFIHISMKTDNSVVILFDQLRYRVTMQVLQHRSLDCLCEQF